MTSLTKEKFRKEYDHIQEIIDKQKNDLVREYEMGRQSMLVSWALDVLPLEDVKEVLFSEH